MDNRLLGMRINVSRKGRGLTAERLSELCHINATYLRQIECGRKLPSLPVFILICNALEVSPNYLLQDALGKNELSALDGLTRLMAQATPNQLGLVIALVHTALKETSDDMARLLAQTPPGEADLAISFIEAALKKTGTEA